MTGVELRGKGRWFTRPAYQTQLEVVVKRSFPYVTGATCAVECATDADCVAIDRVNQMCFILSFEYRRFYNITSNTLKII